jgi:hypothetical protein
VEILKAENNKTKTIFSWDCPLMAQLCKGRSTVYRWQGGFGKNM